jgi:hypothetical protein
MTTYSTNPTYYQVTWNLTSPNDYSSLPGTQAGGLDSTSAFSYNRLVTVTGTTAISTNVMADGEKLIINGYPITFDSSMDLATVIATINAASKYTGVIADQRVASTYVTFANAPGLEGYTFYLANGSTGSALTKLGVTAATYNLSPSVTGGAFSTVSDNSNVTINGIAVTFSGSSNLASVAAQLNAQAEYTGVAAQPAATVLQLSGLNGVPWAINGGNAVANMGFTVGNYGGYPTQMNTSQSKSRANMRWTQAIAEMEKVALPVYLGNIVRTGNLNGNGACTTFQFTVGYNNPNQVITVAGVDEPDAGNVLMGPGAIKRSIARAMTSTLQSNQMVFDPTLESAGAYTARPNAQRIQTITAGALDIVANIAIVEQNITVTQITGI